MQPNWEFGSRKVPVRELGVPVHELKEIRYIEGNYIEWSTVWGIQKNGDLFSGCALHWSTLIEFASIGVPAFIIQLQYLCFIEWLHSVQSSRVVLEIVCDVVAYSSLERFDHTSSYTLC